MNISSIYEHSFKVLILGDSSVGKTNLLLRFSENDFMENHITTIGVDYRSKILEIEDKTIRLELWDTAGQERFMSVNKSLFRRVQGFVLVYDVTEPSSFNNVEKWFANIRNATENVPVILLGNKVDLPKKIQCERGEKFAENNEIDFYETSAKENINVDSAFEAITRSKKYFELDRESGRSQSCCGGRHS